MATKSAHNPNPLLALVGATDLAVERARVARDYARATRAQLRADLSPPALQERTATLIDQMKTRPAQTLVDGAEQVEQNYADLAARGERLIERIQNQQATQDLLAEAKATITLGKGAITTARTTADDIATSAKATVTTGRREAAKVADTVSGTVINSVTEDAKVAADEAKTAAKRTTAAAKRTRTTARKSAKRTTTAAKATRTSATRTAKKSTKATSKAASKVGA